MRKILFLGQKPIGQGCFERLLGAAGSNFEVVGAVSNGSAEGTWWADDAIARACEERGLPFIDNGKRRTKQLLELIAATSADLLISVQHAWILPERVLTAVAGQALNLHLAPLPEYQGWNAGSHALLNGDDSFGVTLHWMTAQVDQGDLAYVVDFPLEGSDTARSLYTKAERAAEEAFGLLVADLEAGAELPRRPMQGEARYYGRDELHALREVDVSLGATELDRRARAFFFPPYEPAYLSAEGGRRVYLLPQSWYAEERS